MNTTALKIKNQTISKTVLPKKDLNLPDELKSKNFARPMSHGQWGPVVDSYVKFLLDMSINPRVKTVVNCIYERTIKFGQTYTILKRSTITEKTSITKGNLSQAIRKAVELKLLFEVKQKNDSYLYALNPDYFDGLIVVKDIPPQKIHVPDTETQVPKVPTAGTQSSHAGNPKFPRQELSPQKNTPQTTEIIKEKDADEKCLYNSSSYNPISYKTSYQKKTDLKGQETEKAMSLGQRFIDFIRQTDYQFERLWRDLTKDRLQDKKEDLGLWLQAVKHLIETRTDFYEKPLESKPYYVMAKLNWDEVKSIVQNWNAAKAEKEHEEFKKMETDPEIKNKIVSLLSGLGAMPKVLTEASYY